MIVGIIGAMDIETKKVKEKLSNISTVSFAKMEFCCGKIANNDVVIASSFEGKVNAAVCTQILISQFKVDYVINIGVAGAVSNKLKICDIVISSSTVEFDLDTTILGYDLGYVFGLNTVNMECDKNLADRLFNISNKFANSFKGKIASSDKFVSDESITKLLQDKFDAIAVDMESASICHVCKLNNVPFCAIRVISDGCSDREYREFLELALDKLDKIVYKFLEE